MWRQGQRQGREGDGEGEEVELEGKGRKKKGKEKEERINCSQCQKVTQSQLSGCLSAEISNVICMGKFCLSTFGTESYY